MGKLISAQKKLVISMQILNVRRRLLPFVYISNNTEFGPF